MNRSRLSAAGLLLAAAVVGAVVGAVVAGRGDNREGRGSSRGSHEGYVERMTTELGLTQPQQDSVRAILQRFEPAMDSLWRDMRPRFDSLRQVARGAIASQLDAEQQEQYQAMLARRDSMYRERRSDGRN